jgi:pimeloyl-ACP methyl ester carboxylesterase
LREWAQAQIRSNPPLGVVAATVALRSTSTAAWAGRVDVPTVCVIPILDTVVPIVQQEALARLIPRATVVELKADHGAFVQAPDAFADAVAGAVTIVADRS